MVKKQRRVAVIALGIVPTASGCSGSLNPGHRYVGQLWRCPGCEKAHRAAEKFLLKRRLLRIEHDRMKLGDFARGHNALAHRDVEQNPVKLGPRVGKIPGCSEHCALYGFERINRELRSEEHTSELQSPMYL